MSLRITYMRTPRQSLVLFLATAASFHASIDSCVVVAASQTVAPPPQTVAQTLAGWLAWLLYLGG